jgi:hypothetical protein
LKDGFSVPWQECSSNIIKTFTKFDIINRWDKDKGTWIKNNNKWDIESKITNTSSYQSWWLSRYYGQTYLFLNYGV